ncbi:MAG: hypothetical protein FWD32_00555, partial [Firmicutes bacterium]|nr:hypothetical protein [Bacillota bacterium]
VNGLSAVDKVCFAPALRFCGFLNGIEVKNVRIQNKTNVLYAQKLYEGDFSQDQIDVKENIKLILKHTFGEQ